jgi:hypothetical protein
MMAHAVADVAEPPAERAPEKDMTMTARVGGDLAAVLLGALRKAGFTPAGSTHFRGVDVTEEVRE